MTNRTGLAVHIAVCIMIYRCRMCGMVTFLPEGPDADLLPWTRRSGDCDCGAEFYPVARRIILGEAMTIEQILGEALASQTRGKRDGHQEQPRKA